MGDEYQCYDYKCTFDLLDDSQYSEVTVENMGDVVQGFWVDKDLNFTKYANSHFYIMPHMIVGIEKVYRKEDKT